MQHLTSIAARMLPLCLLGGLALAGCNEASTLCGIAASPRCPATSFDWTKPDSRPNFDEPIPSKKQIERQKSDGCGQKCATRRAVRELERKADRRK